MEDIKKIDYRIIIRNKNSIIKDAKFNIFGFNNSFKDKNDNKRLIVYKFIINYFMKLLCAYLSILFYTY